MLFPPGRLRSIWEKLLKARLTVIFALIVLLPLVILGWLGVRVARNERIVIEQRFNALALDRLRDVDLGIAAFLEQRERELLSLPRLSALTLEQLRSMGRESATVRQFFVLNERDELHYPISMELLRDYVASSNGLRGTSVPPLPPQEGEDDGTVQETGALATLTPEEKAFLDRTHAIWAGKRIPATDTELALPGTSPVPVKGWYAWHWGDGLNLIFWWRDMLGVVTGAELNPARFVSDIVGALPDTHPGTTTLPDGRIVLLDSRGGTMYQWGAYEPAEDLPPAASLSLRAPLSSWRLDYYAAPDLSGALSGRGVMFNVVSGLAVMVLAVMGLAVYYYRETSREMREALQRVSFVNQVSHELKTPLTSIRMYAEMLEADLDESNEQARNHVGVIVAESQRLSRLIGNVLTFSRKQRSTLQLHSAPGCIDGVVRDVLDHFRPVLEAKGFQIAFDAHAGREVLFDRDALEQILGNLLGNIEKYAGSGNRVEVVSHQEGSLVSITVTDNGPGIPPRERDRIFEPFYRISNKLTDGVSGAGIGLAIARDLARLHRGDLTLEPGAMGACFKVSILAPKTGRGGEAS